MRRDLRLHLGRFPARIDAPAAVWAAFGLLFLVAAVPILATVYPPLFDYPNHLARMYLLVHLPDSPELRRYYAIHWAALPNLAMDLVVPPLCRVMSLLVAGRAFLLLTLLVMALGPVVLNRVVHGSWSAAPLIGFLFLYNKILFWGFLNFLFGVGLSLLCFAGWIALEGRPVPLRLGAGIVFACLVCIAHLEAAGLYGLMVVGYEAGCAWHAAPSWSSAAKRLLVAGAPLLVPLAVLAANAHGLAAGGIAFAPWGHKADNWGNIFGSESLAVDAVCLTALVAAIALAFWRGWLRLAPPLRSPLIVLCAAYVAMPTHVFTGYGADHRMPLAIALLFVAGLQWISPVRRTAAWFFGGALAIFVAQISSVTASWVRSDRLYATLMPVIEQLPQGSRLAVAFPSRALNLSATPLAHFPLEAVIRRGAFVTTLFAMPAQQPVWMVPPYNDVAAALEPERLWAYFVDGRNLANTAALRDIDAILFVGARPAEIPPSPLLKPMGGEAGFQLFRLVPQSQG